VIDFKKTFKYDHLVRNEKGVPMGRVIMWKENEYVEGEDIKVSIMSLPVQLIPHPLGQYFYIDTYKYQTPIVLDKVKWNKNGLDWYLSNFVLKRVV
jgi:hypothetical protein